MNSSTRFLERAVDGWLERMCMLCCSMVLCTIYFLIYLSRKSCSPQNFFQYISINLSNWWFMGNQFLHGFSSLNTWVGSSLEGNMPSGIGISCCVWVFTELDNSALCLLARFLGQLYCSSRRGVRAEAWAASLIACLFAVVVGDLTTFWLVGDLSSCCGRLRW